MTGPARKVVRRKGVQAGEPCLEGTRLPTRSLWALFHRGFGVAKIAEFYGHPLVDVEAVEVALRYEMRRRKR